MLVDNKGAVALLGVITSRSTTQREMVGPAVTLRTEFHMRYGNEQQMYFLPTMTVHLNLNVFSMEE